MESAPDEFIRYKYPQLLDDSRRAIADVLRVPQDTVVFVPNATNAINAILRNMQWNSDRRDEIIYFDTIYGACGKTIKYMVDSCYGYVSSRAICLEYPCEDNDVVAWFREAVAVSKAAGRRPRLCVYDTVSSVPGVRFPFEILTATCKELGVMSIVDGAQGVGMIEPNLSHLDPDFFFSNCHKWLHVPRGCAVLYVPLRNQSYMVSTLPTSHGYVPRTGLPLTSGSTATGKNPFIKNFEGMGTVDNSPYLCVKDSIKWRREVLGGEETIMKYTTSLAKQGGEQVARALGTEVMDNSTRTLTNCAMVNVRLPLNATQHSSSEEAAVVAGDFQLDEAVAVSEWMMRTLVDDYRTFIVVYQHAQNMWVRLSSQVYLDLEDFEWAGRILAELCERVKQAEWRTTRVGA